MMMDPLMDFLFLGVGWTDLAITLNRIAVGAFFMLSGYHKLFNAERHRSIVDELKALGVPALGFNQWWVPLVEFAAGGAVLFGLWVISRRAWPASHHPCRHSDVRAAANQTPRSRSMNRTASTIGSTCRRHFMPSCSYVVVSLGRGAGQPLRFDPGGPTQ